MSLGIATRPSLPLARRIAPAPSSPLDRVVGVVSATSPPRRRRHPDAPRPNASSWSQSQCRPFVAPRPCRRPLSRLPTGPLARRRRSSRRCVAVSSRRRRPSRSRPSSVRALPPRARSPSPVVLVACPPVATRRLCVVATTPSSVVVGRRRHRHFAVAIVAAVIGVNTLGHGSRHLHPRALSVMFAAIGRRLSSFGRHRRPPPVAAVVVVDPRLYPHPCSCSATLPPASPTWAWDPRRRRVVVVLAAALWSSSSSGLVLAAAGWQCFDGAGPRGQNMRATPALPIPRFCSEHQNNVNQTSALAAAVSAGPGEPDNIETSLGRRRSRGVHPRRTGRSRLPVPQLSVPTRTGSPTR